MVKAAGNWLWIHHNIKREVGRGHPAAAPASAAGPEARGVTILMHTPQIRSSVPCIAPGHPKESEGEWRENENLNSNAQDWTHMGSEQKAFHRNILTSTNRQVPLLHKPDGDLIIVDKPISGTSESRLLDTPANYHLSAVLPGESFCLHPISQGTAQVFRVCDYWIQEILFQQLLITYYYNICNKNTFSCCGMVLIKVFLPKSFPTSLHFL